MSFQTIFIVSFVILLTLLIGYHWGEDNGFDKGYETAINDYNSQGEFLGKGDRDMFYK